jgi:5-methylcytosine-specific restriction endonuclease McrA
MTEPTQAARTLLRQSPKTCNVDGCSRPVHCKEMCQAHYRRLQRTGSTRSERPITTATPDGSQWCNQCRAVKPLVEFPSAVGRKRGVASFCLECFAQLARTRYRPAIYIQQAAWRRLNSAKVSEYGRAYRQSNPEKVRARLRRNRELNPERYRKYARIGDRNRRARERAAKGRATGVQQQARWDYFGGLCWMCGSAADVLDHVKPLAKNGTGWPANLRPACNRCNQRKRARWPYPLEVIRGGPRTPRVVAEADRLDRRIAA